MLMHSLLQMAAHLPHLVQLSGLNFTLSIDAFEVTPKKVPTGQITLQKNRPRCHAIAPIPKKKTMVIESGSHEAW
jgi:hypothetical protein